MRNHIKRSANNMDPKRFEKPGHPNINWSLNLFKEVTKKCIKNVEGGRREETPELILYIIGRTSTEYRVSTTQIIKKRQRKTY